jgi:hypothetical protein
MRAIKIGASLLAAIFLLFAFTLMQNKLLFQGGENYTFYVGNNSSNCQIIYSDTPAITKLTLDRLCGECAYFESINASDLIESLNAQVVFVEVVDDSTNYYCSAPLPYSISLYGKTINLHVCVKGDVVVAASPIIFGGY